MFCKFYLWFMCLSGGDYIDFATLILTIIGGAFALFQWWQSNKIKRAEFVNKLIEKIRNDKDISDTMYLIDYGTTWYTLDFHNNKNGMEFRVDKMLSYFSYICYLKDRRLIKKKDFEFFNYEIKRLASNNDIQSYLFNLYHFADKQNVEMSFVYFFKYCYDNKLFPISIKDPNAKGFIKLLNF